MDRLRPVLNTRAQQAADGARIVIGSRLETFAAETQEGFLSMAFPHLFFDAVCPDITSKNILPVIHHLIKFVSPKYQADSFLMFYLFNRWLRQKTGSHVSFKLYSSFAQLHSLLEQVNPNDLSDPSSPLVRQLLSTVTNLTASQKGTKGWKNQGRKEATSLHRLCGPPAIFLTLSSPEAHCLWTNLFIQRRIALLQNPALDARTIKLDSPTVSRVPFAVRRLLCSSHPGEVAQAFALRLDAIMHCIKLGLLGKYEACFLEIEYQQRGAQHAHMLLWVNPLIDWLFTNNDNIITPELQQKIIKFVDHTASNEVHNIHSDNNAKALGNQIYKWD